VQFLGDALLYVLGNGLPNFVPATSISRHTVDLSGRLVCRIAVQPFNEKYFASRTGRNSNRGIAVPPHKRGVSRSSRTYVRDAVDAGGAKDERARSRTAKSCGPDAPTLASSW
jgi:hypothetical protein